MRKLPFLGIALIFITAAVACRHTNINDKLEPRMFRQKVNEAAPQQPSAYDRGPQAAAEAQFANRAYPDQDVPANAHDVARETYASIAAQGSGSGAWDLIGAGRARYPGLLTYTGKEYVASGRITALAIAPSCTPSSCRLWTAAAGGGIWRTDRALDSTPKWTFLSGSFATNAIGSLVLDPADPTGRTIYAGTGEPNASVDSAAGVGIYKSTDGGDTWNALPGSKAAANGRAVAAIAIDPTNPLVLYIGTTRAIRGITSVTGGGVTLNPAYPGWGLYKSTDGGITFVPLFTNNSTANGASIVGIRGITNVVLDLRNPSTVYWSAFGKGAWRMTGGGAPVQIFVPATTSVNDRTEIAVTAKDNRTRIYLGNGATGGANYSRVFRTDDAEASPVTWKSLTSADRSNPYWATFNFCTGQCWYDMALYTPAGNPDTVFVLGSFQYGEYWRVSNSRGVMMSTTAGEPDPGNNNRTFTDVSWASTPRWQPDGIHPDQHAIVVSPNDPNIFFEGSDGGLMRSDGNWDDATFQCSARGLSGPSLVACQRILSKVPHSLVSMNDNLTTLQFQSLSINPQKPLHSLLGGTQDNGTFDYNGSAALWSQTINGDGGQSGFNVADDKIRFHTYYGPYIDVNFDAANTKSWVWVSDPFILFPENWNFYVPIISDPFVGGSMFIGEQHIWRTKDNGGDKATLETWCSEFKAPPSGPGPVCGDWEPLGGAYGTIAGDLTSVNPLYGGASRAGGYVAAITRSGGDASTMWAATNTGRLFISTNAEAEPASAVTYTRLDTPPPGGISPLPPRFISGIAIDPTNPNRAFLAYTGYNVSTVQKGHVFEALYNPVTHTATFTNLLVETESGDLPMNGIARDDVTGDLYLATDFGVLRRAGSTGTWGLAGSGLPMVEVAGVSINSPSRVLYAATHGRSAWRLMLP